MVRVRGLEETSLHSFLVLYSYRYRWYDPYIARFLSPDPICIWGDMLNLGNGMAYVGMMPYGYIDPMELRGWAAQCGQDLRDWSNNNMPENWGGHLVFGVTNFATSIAFLGEVPVHHEPLDLPLHR